MVIHNRILSYLLSDFQTDLLSHCSLTVDKIVQWKKNKYILYVLYYFCSPTQQTACVLLQQKIEIHW